MRGDPPLLRKPNRSEAGSTPHARGSTLHPEILATGAGVYPACAGIHLPHLGQSSPAVRLPRMRGDPPLAI